MSNSTLKILIVEDEPLAAAQLSAMITTIHANVEILSVCDSIESTVDWIKNNSTPDLAFFDIQLGDGLCFDIFRKVKFETPVIFTTAFDQYTLQAFKVNSIDYLLKPLDKEELRFAIEKFKNKNSSQSNLLTSEKLESLLQAVEKTTYKERFLVKIGNHLKTINTSDVHYFYSFQKGTFIKSAENKNYLIDQTLEIVEQLIDPNKFFRINRKYIVSLNCIINVSIYSNSRLKIKVKNAEEDDFFVSREKVKLFKNWLEGESI
ncbi:MAG: LytTR family DNA-binding domain-containing protein [Prolixibacteraceae bacterium]|jgi:two-component system LytT family response regulator|nr:LytTR family DNA-binding domain-containing protein [Prolixibacteraceae bacterium]